MDTLALPAIALIAAVVNGALGHGFSSITVPLALVFVSNRVLNPALVPIEVALNAYMLWVNRAAVARVQPRVRAIVLGLLPGIVAGTWLVARVDPIPLKLATYVLLLPLIFLQAVGYRRPIRSERAAGAAFGGGVGLLYSTTTISGPPLALLLNNQGLVAHEFRAAMSMIRLAESTLTAGAYAAAGMYVAESTTLIGAILPSVLVGVPLGALIIRRVRTELFRRLCISFDAWIVAFGTATVVTQLQWVPGRSAYLLVVLVGLIDAWLLYRFFAAAARPGIPGGMEVTP